MKFLHYSALALLLLSSSAQAEQRGLVTSGTCPLTCKRLAVPSEVCREWQAGERCFVEDLSQPPGHRSVALVRPSMQVAATSNQDSERRGLVTSAACPFTCKDAGVPKEYCRESKVGSMCQVEDLSQAPGHRSMIRVP